MSINYREELNQSQCEAVMYSDGPSLVIAGAGSGKTRVLTYKIAYLLEQGYKPWHILALTFTNKAAREMKERIGAKVGAQSARNLWMGTFHSIFSRILRTEAHYLGFSSQFTIYDASDSKSLIRAIIKEMGLDEKIYHPSTVQSRISNAKNQLIDPSGYESAAGMNERDHASKMFEIQNIYIRYWDRCKQAGAMDFDDLLFYTYILFRDFPEVLDKYRSQFRYILVDEYQDTNYAQHSIVMQLSGQSQMLCVVGDDAQSIYSFRGSNIDHILNFSLEFPRAKIFKLEQNYRSTQTLVSAANSLIRKNERQIVKKVFSEKERGDAIDVFMAYSDVDEAEIVVNKISELKRKDKYEYSDFAILYRTNSQSRVFEESLRKRGIPYIVYGGLSFYQHKEIKDIIAYFRLIVNPDDEEAFKRIVNYPTRGIGSVTVEKIIESAVTHRVSLWKVISDPSTYDLSLSKNSLSRLDTFRELIEGFINMQSEKNAYDMSMEVIGQSGMLSAIYQEDTPDSSRAHENVTELTNGIHDFCTRRLEEGFTDVSLSAFLSEVSLLTDQDSDKDSDEEKVVLMTVHSAKGLEFPNVFVVGLEENLFPGSRVSFLAHALEEERRLFYVAITRAEDHCFLSFAKSRFRYGKRETSKPSQFLQDIDIHYLNIQEELATSYRPPVRRKYEESAVKAPIDSRMKPVDSLPPSSSSPSQSTTPIDGLRVGQTIEHGRFGIGEVVKVEGEGDNMKATIHFRNSGEKHLLLRFARFTILK